MEEGRRRKRKNKFSFLGCKYFTQELSNGQKGTDAILFPSSATYPAYQVEKIKLQMSLCVNINKKPSPVFSEKIYSKKSMWRWLLEQDCIIQLKILSFAEENQLVWL